MRKLRRFAVLAAAACLLTACGSHAATPAADRGAPTSPTHRATAPTHRATAPTSPTSSPTAPTSQPISRATSNHYVASAALVACRTEVELVTSAEEAASAMDGSEVPLRQLVPIYLQELPAYVGSWDMAAHKPVVGGGTSTKVAPPGCG